LVPDTPHNPVAWVRLGREGHAVITLIAEQNMTPAALERGKAILGASLEEVEAGLTNTGAITGRQNLAVHNVLREAPLEENSWLIAILRQMKQVAEDFKPKFSLDKDGDPSKGNGRKDLFDRIETEKD
jgi:hypothetical protein